MGLGRASSETLEPDGRGPPDLPRDRKMTTALELERQIRELLDAAREKKSRDLLMKRKTLRGPYNCLKREVMGFERLLVRGSKTRPDRVPGRRPRKQGPVGRRRWGIPMEKAEYDRRFAPRLRRAAGCLIWQGAVDRHGCPRVKVKGRMVTLGRLAHETFVGPVPRGQQVRHQRSCMSRRCVNPRHLFWWGRDPSGSGPPVWRAHIVAWRLTQQSVRKLLERGRGDGKLERPVNRLMILEEHAHTIELLKTQINLMLSWEREMQGIPLPEAGANLAVLGRMLEQHFKLQQALGYIPSGGLYAGRRGTLARIGDIVADSLRS